MELIHPINILKNLQPYLNLLDQMPIIFLGNCYMELIWFCRTQLRQQTDHKRRHKTGELQEGPLNTNKNWSWSSNKEFEHQLSNKPTGNISMRWVCGKTFSSSSLLMKVCWGQCWTSVVWLMIPSSPTCLTDACGNWVTFPLQEETLHSSHCPHSPL